MLKFEIAKSTIHNEWLIGVAKYSIIKNEIIPISQIRVPRSKQFVHVIIGRQFGENISFSTITSSLTSRIGKNLSISHEKFIDFSIYEPSKEIHFISKPIILSIDDFSTHFEFENNFPIVLELLGLAHDTNKDIFLNNLVLNFKNFFNQYIDNEEEVKQFSLVKKNENLQWELKIKKPIFIIDEMGNIYYDKIVDAEKINFNDLKEYFDEIGKFTDNTEVKVLMGLNEVVNFDTHHD